MKKIIIGLSILFSSCAYAEPSTVCELVTNTFDFGTRVPGTYIGANFPVEFRCSNNDVDFEVFAIEPVLNTGGGSEFKQYDNLFRGNLLDESNPKYMYASSGYMRDGWYYYNAEFNVDWLGNSRFESNGYTNKEGFDTAGIYNARMNYMVVVQGVRRQFYIDYTMNINPTCGDLDNYRSVDFGVVPAGQEAVSRDVDLRIECTKDINEVSVYPSSDIYEYQEGIGFRFMTIGADKRHITIANPYKYNPTAGYGAVSLELFNPNGGLINKTSTFYFNYSLIVEY